MHGLYYFHTQELHPEPNSPWEFVLYSGGAVHVRRQILYMMSASMLGILSYRVISAVTWLSTRHSLLVCCSHHLKKSQKVAQVAVPWCVSNMQRQKKCKSLTRYHDRRQATQSTGIGFIKNFVGEQHNADCATQMMRLMFPHWRNFAMFQDELRSIPCIETRIISFSESFAPCIRCIQLL